MIYQKTIIIFFLILFLLCIFIPKSLALNTYIYELPDPRNEKVWVSDLANILESKTENILNQILAEVNLKYRSEIVIVTVSDVSPYNNPQQLAKYIFNIWHITRMGFNDGALFLVSQKEHSAAIIAGFMRDSAEPNYEDRKFQVNVRRITTEISELLNQNNYEEAILLGTQKLVILIKDKKFKYFKHIPEIIFP